MNLEELRYELDILFNPEPEEGIEPREFAHPLLKKRYGLDTSYLETLAWEGSTIHEHTRIVSIRRGESPCANKEYGRAGSVV